MPVYPYYNKYLKRAKKLKAKVEAMEDLKEQEFCLQEYYKLYPLDMIYSKQLWIVTQEAQLITLDPTKRPAQMELLELVQDYMKRNKPLLITIPKARRQGVSTIVEAIIYSIASQCPNRRATIIADETKNSSNIFEMTKTFQELVRFTVKPKEKLSNAKELAFDGTHSLINIDSANKVNIGRSWGFQYIHLSEVAFFRNAQTIMTAIMQTLPNNMFIFVALESTGNGIGGYFYDLIQESQLDNNDWQVFFIPWYKHPDYVMEIEEGVDLKLYKEHPRYGEERGIAKQLESLSVDNVEKRMRWRRWCIRNKCDNKLKIFKSEYPMTIKEVFQASGVNVFDIDQVDAIRQQTKPPILRGIIDERGNFKASDNGWVEIWELPEKNWSNRYNIGVDTGGTWFESPANCADYSVATVYDQVEMVDVAKIRGHYAPKLLVQYLCNLGRMYNNGRIVVEINKWASEVDDSGLTIIDYIRDKYANLYRRLVYDKIVKQDVKKIGFHTNVSTRPLLVNHMEELIRSYGETGEIINDKNLCDELDGFVVIEKTGKYEHHEGGKDDMLFSQAIARYTAGDMGKAVYDDGSEELDYDSMIDDDPADALT